MLYTRLFVRKRSMFSIKVVFYRTSTCTVMIYSHLMQSFTPPLSLSLFTNAHYTVCVCERPSFWVLRSFSWRDVRNGCPAAAELHRNVWNVCIYSSCRLDHCTFHSPQIKFAPNPPSSSCFCFCSAQSFWTSLASSCDVGDQDILPFLRHSHSTRSRLGSCLLLERKWNSIAIIKPCWSE